MNTKTCRLCGEEKPLADFHRHKSHKDGHHSACKPCAIAEQNRSHQKVVASVDGTKACSLCKVVKPLEDFVRNRNFGDGRNHVCKTCLYAQRKAWGQSEHGLGILRVRDKSRYDANPTIKNRKIERRYGLPPGTYTMLYEAQNGECAICGRSGHTRGQRIGVDHDHTTNAIRGLLCTPCNQGLGQFQESPELFRRAIAYLEDPPAVHLNLTSAFERKPKV